MKSAVVVPSNRPERVRQFVAAWQKQFERPDVRVILCEDASYRTSHLVPDWVEHYSWAEIDAYLGERAWCIPRRSGGIRSFGFWLAGQDETIDMVVSLDDDVVPVRDPHITASSGRVHIQECDGALLPGHWQMLEQPRVPRWVDTMGTGDLPRGYPYSLRSGVKPMLNHGMWEGMPDVDAYTQLRNPDICYQRGYGLRDTALIPPGMYYANCGMNYAFRREVAPFCYFPPLPDGMKRWDDIWSGIVFKRVADLHGWAVTSGYPCVRHERASDPLNNLRQEMLGYGINERLWQVVDQVPDWSTPLRTYLYIAATLGGAFPELRVTAEAMGVWASLWRDHETAR